MEHSIALVTGATSGLGPEAARCSFRRGLARDYRYRSQPGPDPETSAQLAAEAKKTGLHAAGAGSGQAVQRPVRPPPSSSSEVGPLISYRSMQGWSEVTERVLTAAGVEAAQAPLIGHHQLKLSVCSAPTR